MLNTWLLLTSYNMTEKQGRVEVLCTISLMLFIAIGIILTRKNPHQMTDEEMSEQVMTMEMMDDDSWDEPWDEPW